MKKKIDSEQIELGMYIYELDRPWTETPFLFQGFNVSSEEDIKQLKACCDYVYVIEEQHLQSVELSRPSDKPAKAVAQLEGLPEKPVHYKDSSSVEKELGPAKQSYETLFKEVRELVQNIHLGLNIDTNQITKAVDSMVESIIRNPDAFFWLSKLKELNSYAYNHAIDSSALAVALGRNLGFSKEELSELAIGVLLCDIGNTKLPRALFSKPGHLSAEDRETVKRHVNHSVAIMRATKNISELAINIAYTHHERFDGSGYPRGLQGNDIPIGGRIAAIVDYYDAITSDRPYNSALAPHLAIRKLYERRNTLFQEELVEQFIQTLGVYPTGSLVELSTGEVGIVIAQNRLRALRPKIMLILDKDKVAYGIYPTIDLISEQSDKEGRPIEILRAVEPHTYGINPKDFYL